MIKIIGKHKIITICILIIILMAGYIIPSIAMASDISILGTNAALGSPLLDPNFRVEDWNKWELIAFGVFLSNFTYPLVDDYVTAFTTSSEGTRGAGFKALQFGSGSDTSNNAILKELLNYTVSNQKSVLKRIKVRYKRVNYIGYEQSGTENSITEEATIKDLFRELSWLDNFNPNTTGDANEPWVALGTIARLDDTKDLYGPIATNLPQFIVNTGSSGENEKIVYDFYDGWDMQMFVAWLSRVSTGGMAEQATRNLRSLMDAEAPLCLDTYGNIVALSGDKAYVVIPAAANQHITYSPQYNLLQSVLFNNSYINASGQTVIDKAEAESGYMGGKSAFGGNKSVEQLGEGNTVIFYDTDVLVYQKLMELLKNGELNNAWIEGGPSSISNTAIIGTDTEKLEWGNILDTLFSSDIDSEQLNKVGFKIEAINADGLNKVSWIAKLFGKEREASYWNSLGNACESLSSMYPIDPKVPILNYVNTRGRKQSMFENPVVTSVNINSTDADSVAYRRYISNLYNMLYVNNDRLTSTNAKSVIEYRAELKSLKTIGEVAKWAYTSSDAGSNWDNNGIVSPILAQFITDSVGQTFNKPTDNKPLDTVTLGELDRLGYKLLNGSQYKPKEQRIKDSFSRIVKVYTYSNVMKQVSNVLSIREGTDFSIWSPYIYATYLEWYGIIGGGAPKFDTALFNEKSDIFNFDIAKASKGNFLTAEQKKDAIMEYSYMMLHPTAGREYRAQMVLDGTTDWLYRTYQNIVFGKAIESYSYNNQNLATRSSAGFLHMDSYSDNFMTGWFMQGYARYVVYILGISLILIIVVGVLTHKKFIWYIASLLLLVNVVLLLPSIGEITPYIANNMVQNMFKDKMSYWAMSESISNATIEKDIYDDVTYSYKYSQGLSNEEATQVSNLVKMLNIVYLDRAIMVKTDISKKVTETQLTDYAEIQRLQSARWMLPILLRQFSASDGSANYVYIPLGDVYDNMSNLYWHYVPSDMINSQTANGASGLVSQNTVSDYDRCYTVEVKRSLYEDYVDTSMDAAFARDSYSGVVIGWPGNDSYRQSPGWQSSSRSTDDTQAVHTVSYLLTDLTIPSIGITYDNYKNSIWRDYIENNMLAIRDQLLNKTDIIEQYAGTYNPWEPDTVKDCFGYLWATENPGNYFYQVVKDTMEPDDNLATLAGKLQGYYQKSELLGTEVRHSFMHYRDTGKIKDFLDMEELFTNTIPYLYKVQLLAGGFDGDSGALGDAKINKYTLYENNNKSWLYRSNWVTKLMESSTITSPENARDSKDKVYNIKNPILPACYPDERPMIFSEAQMYALGLSEADLTTPELKILKVNKEVERKWTLLLNYVNIPGVTKEVIFRQMAIDALLEFNKEFSSANIINPSAAMYPTGLDLRSISFDSVMKMLMLNTTKDSRYIYGDTMKRTIENSDIISAWLMLIGAFLCSYIIPLMRNIAMGLLFYLAIWAVLGNMLSGGKMKLKITTALVINSIVYLVMTLLYYQVFSLMISLTYTDNVLSLNNIVINVGNPVWIFVVILIASLAYIYGTWRLIEFSVKNYRDLGFEVYATWAGMLANNLSDKIRGAGDSIANALSGASSDSSSTGASVGGNRRRRKDNEYTTEVVVDGGNINANVESDDIEENEIDMRYGDSGYILDSSEDGSDYFDNDDIDREIEKGKNM